MLPELGLHNRRLTEDRRKEPAVQAGELRELTHVRPYAGGVMNGREEATETSTGSHPRVVEMAHQVSPNTLRDRETKVEEVRRNIGLR